MATDTSPQDDAQQQPPARRPFWKLREDDQRPLLITFLGGLAANIGLVPVLALGLLVVRLIHKLGLVPMAVIVAGLNMAAGFTVACCLSVTGTLAMVAWRWHNVP